MELPDIAMLARVVGARSHAQRRRAYPRRAGETLGGSSLRELGERYLEQTRIQRKTAGADLHRQDAEQLRCTSGLSI